MNAPVISSSRRTLRALVPTLFGAIGATAMAADWTAADPATASGTWSTIVDPGTAGYWTNLNTEVPASLTNATIGVDITADTTITLDAPAAVTTALTIGDANASNKYTIAGTTTNNLSLQGTLTQAATSVGDVISAPITLSSNLSVTNNASAPLTLSGAITTASGKSLTNSGNGPLIVSGAVGGAGGITQSGTGTLTLGGYTQVPQSLALNAASGATALFVASTSGIAANQTLITGTGFAANTYVTGVAGAATATMSPSANQAATGTVITVTSTTGLVAGMAVIGTGIAANTTINSITATTITLSAATTTALTTSTSLTFYPRVTISPATTAAITAPATLSFANASSVTNSYSGTTSITAGTVAVALNANLGANAAPVSLNGGTLQMSTPSNGQVWTHPITVGANGGTLKNTGNWWNLTTAGTLSGSGALLLLGDGTLTSLNVSTTYADANQNTWVIPAANTGFSGSVTLDQGAIIQFSNANSLGSTTGVAVKNGELSINGVTCNRAVTLQGGVLGFSAGNNGVMSGNLLVDTAGGTIGMRDYYGTAPGTARNGLISGVISGSGPLAIGYTSGNTGTLTLTAANDYTGALTLKTGTLQLGNGGTTGSLANISSLTTTGGTIAINRSEDMAQSSWPVLPGSVISGGAGLTKLGTNTLTLDKANTYSGTTTVAGGKLIIPAGGSLTNTGGNTNVVGSAANATAKLDISGGSVALGNTGNAWGSYFRVGSGANTQGFVNLSSGTFAVGRELDLGQNNGVGFLAMSGGTLTTGSFLAVGIGGTGSFVQTGGSVTQNQNGGNGSVLIGSGGYGVMSLSGGTLTSNGGIFIPENNAGSSGILNVSGSAAVTITNGNGLKFGNNNASVTGIVNLLGGSITTPIVQKAYGTAIFNFNGGKLVASAASATFFTGLTNAYVHSGGGTIDNNGKAITIGQALLTPVISNGYGVTSVAITNGGVGYIDAPIVKLSGGSGSGATAVATVSDGVLIGITITNPGTGYLNTDTVTATLVGGGATTAATVGAVGFAASTSGGLTFQGSATTTLSGVNTYTGPTAVNVGTLAVTGSLASTSVTVASGAALTLASNGSLTATTLTLGGAGTVTTTGGLTVGAGRTLVPTGALTLNGGTTFAADGVVDLTAPGSSVSVGALTISGPFTIKLASAPTHGIASLPITATTITGSAAITLVDGAGIPLVNCSAIIDGSTIKVLNNQAPTSDGAADTSVELGAAETTFDAKLGFDFADPDGDVLTYSQNVTVGTGLSIDPATGMISGLTAGTHYELSVTATDEFGAFKKVDFTIDVAAANVAPTIENVVVSTLSVEVGSTMTMSVVATDTDSNISSVEFRDGSTVLGTGTLTSGSQPTGATYTLSWTPSEAGSYNITAKVTDAGGLNATSFAAVPVTVTAANTAPTVTLDAITGTVVTNQAVTLSAAALDNETASSALSVTFSVNGTPLTGAIYNAITNKWEQAWTPTTAGSYTISVVANDGALNSTASTGSVTVTPAPTITREFWYNIDGGSAFDVPLWRAADATALLSDVAASDTGVAYYGSRIRGYITAPTAGDYQFYVAADDSAQLWLSTDGDAAHKVLAASLNSYVAEEDWDNAATSGVVTLAAGQTIYFEVIQAQSFGGDHVELGWTTPSATTVAVVPGSVVTPYTGAEVNGFVKREVWENQDGSDDIALMPLHTLATREEALQQLDAPANTNIDNYASRVRGYITAPVTGYYTFWLAADNRGALWLSSDTDVLGKKRIASVEQTNGYVGYHEWNREAGQKSVEIQLTAGQKYYFEARQKQGFGGDHLSIGWAYALTAGANPSAPSEIVPSRVLSPFNDVTAPSAGYVMRNIWVDATNVGYTLDFTPGSGDAVTASQQLADLDAPVNTGMQYYFALTTGQITAAKTGWYRFWVVGDDIARFNLTADNSAAVSVETTTWSAAPRLWNDPAAAHSVWVHLTADSVYPFVLRHVQGWGGDSMSVGWSYEADAETAPATPADPATVEVIPAEVLSPSIGG